MLLKSVPRRKISDKNSESSIRLILINFLLELCSINTSKTNFLRKISRKNVLVNFILHYGLQKSMQINKHIQLVKSKAQ